MKKTLFIFAFVLLLVAPSVVRAESTTLPTRWTFAKEWISYNVFTLKAESKIQLINGLSNQRTAEIKLAAEQNSADVVKNLTFRLENMIQKQNRIVEKKQLKNQTFNQIKENELSRQAELSNARQIATQAEIKEQIASTQGKIVQQTQTILQEKLGEDKASEFREQVVIRWRDPENKVAQNEEKPTRVYADGTSATGDNGVLIDGGQAKITDENGTMKIEYATGTGPQIVSGANTTTKWKIKQSDGTVIEDYSSANKVVIGQTSENSGNTVINTVEGQTTKTNQPQYIKGNGGTTAGQSIQTLETNTSTETVSGSVNVIENSNDNVGNGGNNNTNNSSAENVVE
ncbi:hypothetical protein GW918_00070 [Candidatus Berkelbacteria bacterium]|uniref:DUF5667 domain-containing protein n=1 Tax=Candidatus Berkelbacteria bacterium CG03_land_8_20_14_0_80_40_36 TaxID=1974509 RepID=A0A2M7CII2_9BACT|nr:hypothetical protein [Candidatus Berkelbacteria bacterium]PIV25433.1 MAG: hypothetical protein COS38_01630 [Candidatus Berkelbacteria bacterium CG03_land_8_20_14_0_80_40_36]